MNKKFNRFRNYMTREQYDELPGTEVKSKRTRFGKVYALGANRFQAVTYTDPVHRYNEATHAWEEIDNRFSATPHMQAAKANWAQGIMPVLEHGEPLLTCKSGNLNVACAMSGEMPFINLTDAKGRHLSWGIKDAVSILPEADDISDTPADNVRGMRESILSRLHGEVTYNGIFAGVDLRCKLDCGFKDELIFAEKESVRPITFLLESEGRSMTLTDENVLHVKDLNNKVVFSLAAPFLLDAKEERGGVAVHLEAQENGLYAMTYIPDEDFIQKATFPVVLDPEIQTPQDGQSIVDTYIREGYTTDFSTDTRFWVTATNYYGKRYGLLRVEELPKLNSNDFITGAYLHLKSHNAPSEDAPVFCSEVLVPWEASSVTFADLQNADGTMKANPLYQDYCKFPASKYTWQQLDVTALARKWYQGQPNYGVLLTPNVNDPITVQIQSSEGSAKPYFTVNYASLAGLESYLTYDSQPVGMAGTGYVSLANGNMIFAHSDTAMNGNRMPVSVTHYYNSCDADKDEFGLGYGWRTNFHQTLHKAYINEEIMYVYTDGDGTEHWFEVDEDDSTRYVDMSGLNLTLTVADSGEITITDKGDGRMIFPAISTTPTATTPETDKVLIQKILDAVGNQISIIHDTENALQIASITDGAGRVTTFTYSSNNYCTAIKTPWQSDNTCTRFAYTNGCLTTITHEDNRVSTYQYENRNDYRLLTVAQGADGLAVRYEYSNTGANENSGLPHCITSAKVTGTQGETALTASDTKYEYGNHLTLVTDNISGKALRYHFNDNGNQISVDDELGFAVYTKYDQSGDNASTPINHATTCSRMQRTVKNLLLDHLMDANSSVWQKSSTGTFTRDQASTLWGPVSYKIQVSSGSEAYLRQTVTLTPGKSYTLSAYMRSGGPKAFVRVGYTMDGVTKYFNSDTVSVSVNASDAPFQRVSVSFTLPEGADAKVFCDGIGQTNSGYFWIDSMQLEEGLTSNHFNLLQNCDFTHTTSGSTVPTGWAIGDGDYNYISIKNLSSADDVDGTFAPEFLQNGKAARLEGRYNRTITLNQDFRCYGNAGDRFTAGGWCKSFAKKLDVDGYVFCSLAVYFTGGSTWHLGGRVDFNYGEDGWQFASGDIVAPYNFTKIRFSLYMNRQMNHADFTGLYLYPEAFGTDYVYDKNGNPKKAVALYGGASAAEYDNADNLTKYTLPGQTKSSTFFYGETEAEQKKHLLKRTTAPEGSVSTFEYDENNGNLLASQVQNAESNPSYFIRSETTYTADGNYVAIQKDARRKAVTTVTDANKGTTTSVTDPKGQTVEYSYDTLRRVTNVNSSVPSANEEGKATFRNEYSYAKDTGLLTHVGHNTTTDACDVTYTFSYDALGRRTGVKVGEVELSRNEYQNDAGKPNYGTLKKLVYGNGHTVENAYDDFNRVTAVHYNGETMPRYEYAYNAKGQVAHVTYNTTDETGAVAQIVTESEYDLSSRPVRVKEHENGKHVYTGEVAYNDTFGVLSEFREKVGESGKEYVTTLSYDSQNRPIALSYGSFGGSTTTLDALNRMTYSSVKLGNTAFKSEYHFAAGGYGSGSLTGLVTSITQTGGNCSYGYDDNGNIANATVNGKWAGYTYDALGQLIRVNDRSDTRAGSTGSTWVYEYDRGGNILSKKLYPYADTSSDPLLTTRFTYGNANWKDQLTAVDGVAITYDAIGNPLNDGTWTYTWQNGRQLAAMRKSGMEVSFRYNANGLRTHKIVNGVVTKYTLHGKNVVHMTKGNDELHFFYDAQNRPAVVVYNGTAYAYVKNLQGDVIAILDSTGAVVVSYAYDAWGQPIGKAGTLASTLGTVQPFRYRGYVYDEETGLYYLRSRYYNAHRCRFLNCDTLIGRNFYCYCFNVPVSRYDLSGCESSTTTEYPDYTNRIDFELERAIYDFVDHSVNSNSQSIPTMFEILKDMDSYLWFVGQVTHHAKWDLKDDNAWANMFPDLPATNESFFYRGELISREDLGNITYGYLGTAMGCSPEMLFIGGGIAKNMTTFSISGLTEALNKVLDDTSLYGDDKNDHDKIQKGIEYYWNDYPNGVE